METLTCGTMNEVRHIVNQTVTFPFQVQLAEFVIKLEKMKWGAVVPFVAEEAIIQSVKCTLLDVNANLFGVVRLRVKTALSTSTLLFVNRLYLT
jgi:hypothetical protein